MNFKEEADEIILKSDVFRSAALKLQSYNLDAFDRIEGDSPDPIPSSSIASISSMYDDDSTLSAFLQMRIHNDIRTIRKFKKHSVKLPNNLVTLQNSNKLSLNTNLLIYNRVPKCGSTTMTTLIKNLVNFHPDTHKYKVINDVEANRKNYLADDNMVKDFIKNVTDKTSSEKSVYIRHVHFVDFTKATSNSSTSTNLLQPVYINIIRDPVEHWISNYYYLRNGFQNSKKDSKVSKKWDHSNIISEAERNLDIQSCIDFKISSCINIYSDIIAFFCGNYSWCRKRDARALEMAKYNVRKNYVAVGLLEELDDTFKYFELSLPEYFNGLEWQYKKSKAKLVTKSKTKHKKSESDDIKNYLTERLQPEIEFYQYVKNLMYQRLFGRK